MYSEHKTSPGQIPEASALHKLAPPSKSPCYGGGRCRRSGAYDRALGPKRAKQMETQQSVFGGHTRGDHAGLQPRGEGTKYTWLEAASGPRPVIIGPRTSTSTPCVCVGGSKKKKARVHCVPFCGEKVAADQACITTTVFSSLRPIQVLRLILGSGDIGMQRSRTRLVAWGCVRRILCIWSAWLRRCSTHGCW
jgi:hypothetical protein